MRRLLAAAVLAIATFAAPISTATTVEAAPVAAPAEAPAPAYLNELLNEINARRAKAGSPPLTYIGSEANFAVSQYLNDLTPQMVALRSCFHGTHNPVAPSWDYVSDSGFAGVARGEVLGCPGSNFYWSPQQIADGWWNSPSHFHSLYADATANAVACGAYSVGNDGRGYQTVACVTYRV
jgi:uncharacterized protein YkwD